MSDELSKAARDAVEAADNTELVRTMAAVLAAQQLVQAQQQTPVVQQTTQRPVGLYVAAGLGGAVALTALAMAAALLAVAVAVGAVCATVCLLVLKSLLDDYQSRR
jgi:EamA domain-containing membrane protein RarD